MRILHLDSGREMRGGQWQALALHRGLLAAGHTSLLLARAGGPLAGEARRETLPCEALSVLRLARISSAFDLVHAHDARTHTLAALAGRAPLVVARRVAFPIRASALSKWKYGRPRLFLAVSRFVAGELCRGGVDERRIEVVFDGVKLPEQAAWGDAVVTPWTLDRQKGMTLAEEAAQSAGVDLVKSRDLPADLRQARVLLYLTRSEGLGSGILLAMALGVTVIASNTGGIPELITHRRNGILVENDPAAAAKALEEVLHCEERPLGHAARQTVRERFTEKHMVDATLAAYGKALA
jgi:hypothetical protein